MIRVPPPVGAVSTRIPMSTTSVKYTKYTATLMATYLPQETTSLTASSLLMPLPKRRTEHQKTATTTTATITYPPQETTF